MTSFEIRQMWLKFFASKNHHIAKSSSLIPRNEANLLWVNAGITPLKKYFDGTQKPPFRRITNVQKCIPYQRHQKRRKNLAPSYFF
uniref:Alanyl-tRNA synthetase n=1 Tax=Onion yellows phytoplasma OY-W TaxID=428984 RepID=A6QKR1_ONYPH|nr:alanyl-tRNA synthetase [Onion yellows phytoplasma OY-W]